MEQRPVGFQCKKNGSSITDKALQRIKTCNNGMHNAESRSVVSYIVGRCVCQLDVEFPTPTLQIQWTLLHEWLQFYLNDTIMQREQENEAVEMAQSICREALQVTQIGRLIRTSKVQAFTVEHLSKGSAKKTGSCPYCAVDLSRSFTSHTDVDRNRWKHFQ
ncbi:hypothetical protein T02_4941 [Trichinella nativa]|uniref:Uncharacterized protein n=1 Tax=Trichinella nativa TaxID=6335 RepID=A0A0V1LP64_9BILA|nr:hypothetical protein T02_4941 [Trichinella nativa]